MFIWSRNMKYLILKGTSRKGKDWQSQWILQREVRLHLWLVVVCNCTHFPWETTVGKIRVPGSICFSIQSSPIQTKAALSTESETPSPNSCNSGNPSAPNWVREHALWYPLIDCSSGTASPKHRVHTYQSPFRRVLHMTATQYLPMTNHLTKWFT